MPDDFMHFTESNTQPYALRRSNIMRFVGNRPLSATELLTRNSALARQNRQLTVALARLTADKFNKMVCLTPRQQQVMMLVLAGHPSKNIAADLNISQRTVENHRAAIMRRTGATSLPALVRLCMGV